MTAREIGRRAPLSVETAAEVYREDAPAVRELFGPHGLLAPVAENPLICFGCAGPRDEPVPIYVQDDVESPTIRLPSIRSLLEA